MGQQPAFDVEQKAAALPVEATQPATAGDDAMAGNDQWIWVGAASLADGTRGIFEVFCQLTVGVGLPERNGRDFGPDAALEVGTGRAQGQAEFKARVGEVGVQLTHRFGGKRGFRRLFGAGFEKVDSGDLVGVALHMPRAKPGAATMAW
jgi:hypothetical protein